MDIQFVSDPEPVNDSLDSEGIEEQSIKKLKPRRMWKKQKVFNNAEEAKAAVAREKTWSFSYKHNTKKGLKVYYRCNKVLKKGRQCAAAIHLHYDSSSTNIYFYRVTSRHDHYYIPTKCKSFSINWDDSDNEYNRSDIEDFSTIRTYRKIKRKNPTNESTTNKSVLVNNSYDIEQDIPVAEIKKEKYIPDNDSDLDSNVEVDDVTDADMLGIKKEEYIIEYVSDDESISMECDNLNNDEFTNIEIKKEKFDPGYNCESESQPITEYDANETLILKSEIEIKEEKLDFDYNSVSQSESIADVEGTDVEDIKKELFESEYISNLDPNDEIYTIIKVKEEHVPSEEHLKHELRSIINQPLNKKKPRKQWKLIGKFHTKKDACAALAEQETWSLNYKHNTSEAEKVYYRCNKVAKRGRQCAACVYLKYNHKSTDIHMYRTVKNHDHEKIMTKAKGGLPDSVKCKIREMYSLNMKPRAILHKLARTCTMIPTKIQINNFLATLKKEKCSENVQK